MKKLGEPSPFVVGVITTFCFSVFVWFYYHIPEARIRSRPAWIQAIYELHDKTIDLRLRDRGLLDESQSQIMLVTVDENALEKLGRWPWPRRTIADVIERAFQLKASLVGFDVVFSEPERAPAAPLLNEILAQPNLDSHLRTKISSELQEEDGDQHLADAIQRHRDQLVMGSYFEEQAGFDSQRTDSQRTDLQRTDLQRTDSHPTARESNQLLPYQELCLDVAFHARPDYQQAVKEQPEILLEDPARTEFAPAIVSFIEHVVETELTEHVQAAHPNLLAPDLEARLRQAQESFCRAWLTEQDPYLASLQEMWPQLQAADATLAHVSFAQFRNQIRTGSEYKYNPLKAMARLWSDIPLLAQSARHRGYFNAFLSLDGSVRRSHLVARYGTHPLPSLALRLAQLARGEDIALELEFDPQYPDSERVKSLAMMKDGQITRPIPVDRSGRLLINYAGPGNSFTHVSAAELLSEGPTMVVEHLKAHDHQIETIRETIPKTSVAGKILIFGATAVGIFDLRVTPFDENYPGLETHANVLANLLEQNFLRTSPFEPKFMPFFIFLLGVLVTFLISRSGAVVGLLITLATLTGLYVIDRNVFFKHGIVTNILFPFVLVLFVNYVLLTVFKYFTEEKRKRELKGTFQKYVSPQIVEQILKDPQNVELGGKKEHMSVLFSDIRGFTTISESLGPTQLGDLLNLYLSPMTRLVFKHQGTLDKYMGDAIMAFFGAPLPSKVHAELACRCALDMMRELDTLQEHFRRMNLPQLDIGIGINTGDMSVGNMGSDIVRSYTVMGDAVNLASRLEGINKIYGTHIVISEFTRRAIGSHFVARELDSVRVKGKLKPVRIFELRSEGPSSSLEAEFLTHFQSGLESYQNQKFQDATSHFISARELSQQYFKQQDRVSELYIERCELFRQQPPSTDWDGVFEMKEK